MLKDRKLKHKEFIVKNGQGEIIDHVGDLVYGFVSVEGFYDTCYKNFRDDDIVFEEDMNDYYFADIDTYIFDSDYHTYTTEHHFKGTYLAFNLNLPETMKFFGVDLMSELFDKDDFLKKVRMIFGSYGLIRRYDDSRIEIDNNRKILEVSFNNISLEEVREAALEVLEFIENYFTDLNIHITRMFGAYVLLKNVDGQLKAVKSTPVPIKYCPLMVKLLKEVGGEESTKLIEAIRTDDVDLQTKMMCHLIDEVVIKGGYFDTNRPLNSCEANVTFGASETISSAFKNDMLDAAVIVSNNLGTIITTNEFNTQGAVKRMTGLFYTSPSPEIIKTAEDSSIVPVFPYTAEIDQVEGVREAIRRGYKRIAVTLAAGDNKLWDEIKKLETDDIIIYKFALCSTGITEDVAKSILENADIVWSCASKYVKEFIEPNAIAQVGVKIPVHIMTKKGWNIVKNHLIVMSDSLKLDDVSLEKGEQKPVMLNTSDGIKKLVKKDVYKCDDCPHPCI